jgi:hypothetical protein
MLVSSYEQVQQWKKAGALLLACASDVQMLLDGFMRDTRLWPELDHLQIHHTSDPDGPPTRRAPH